MTDPCEVYTFLVRYPKIFKFFIFIVFSYRGHNNYTYILSELSTFAVADITLYIVKTRVLDQTLSVATGVI